jgi:hypothetical protein
MKITTNVNEEKSMEILGISHKKPSSVGAAVLGT